MKSFGVPAVFRASLAALVLFACFAASVCRAQESQAEGTAAQNSVSVPPRSSLKEDWRKLTLEGSQLVPIVPVLGHSDDGDPRFTQELWQVMWRPGDPIDLYVIKPHGVEKPPVILYLYGYPNDTTRFMDAAYLERITSKGFAAVGFVSALTGQRYEHGGRPMKEWFGSELQESLASTTHDVQMILNFLESRGDEFDLSRVGMLGQGSGAAIAILAAAADPRIKAIDLIDPWGDWANFLPETAFLDQEDRTQFLTPEFLSKIAPLDPVQWLPKLQGRSIRMQLVDGDMELPAKAMKSIRAAAPDSAEVIEYGDVREFVGAASGNALFDWLKNELLPASAQELREQREQPAAAADSASQVENR
jgi:pimeloyl-ACP methyl ester carboxylesterase